MLLNKYFRVNKCCVLFLQGLEINDFSRNKIEQTGQELVEEREEALSVCKD